MMLPMARTWASLIFALLLTTQTIAEKQEKQKKQRSKQQQQHSNAIMGEAGVTNSPMIDNPAMSLAQNYNYHAGQTHEHDASMYDAPDDCHFAAYQTTNTAANSPTNADSIAENSASHNNEDIILTCNLRTVNSEFDTTNFSVIPAEHTLALHVLCNNEIMAKSSLEPNSFAHLFRLRELSLQYCKFEKFPQQTLNGLLQLRNLTIRTHNTIWSSLNMHIEANSFESVKNLERLDISTNNIWTLPAGIFCSLSALTYLNISANSLQDVNELGFRDLDVLPTTATIVTTKMPLTTCNMDLFVLDCSLNHFVLLPAYGFGALRRLQTLLLQHNEISMLADRALSGLKNLQILNLSSNKIVALPSELFKEQASTIQEIYLQNNTISVLSPNLFANLKQLQALDISFNQITSTWMNSNTFNGLIRLVSLNLSHNRLSNLTPDMFIDLYTLQVLNLRHNQLEALTEHQFAPLHNLHTLLLSYNKLKYLDANALNGLYVLSLVSLDNNALIDVHAETFRNCSTLQDLNLNGNRLTAVPIALRNMHLLRTVDLGENLISNFDQDAFQGLSNLYGLRLISNNISSITKQTFGSIASLQILNLARNRISFVEKSAFDANLDLQAIRLDGNLLTDINGIFTNMPSLLWLNISDNKLINFDYAQVPLSLQWLDLHNNQLQQLNNGYAAQQMRLQTLDLSFNQLQRINAATLPNSVKLVFLNNNLIKIVEADAFIHKTNLTRVDLYANQITTLDMKSLRIHQILDDERALPEFYIGGNPYICDCNIDWLQKINYIRTRQYPRIMDLSTVYCKMLNNREQSFISLVEAEPKHFLCNYKTHCFAVCHCCEFDACDCEMTCPLNCTCFHDQTWTTNIVECSNAGYAETPNNVPMDTTELYIDGNNLNELPGYAFLGRKNLNVLYINASNVQFIYNTTFSGLKRLLVLHLEENLIKSLSGSEFDSLDNLQQLYLHNNDIMHIANGTFRALNKLQILRLDGNRLVQFEIWQLTYNNLLIEIGLDDNQWTCECEFLLQFRNYLQINAKKIINLALLSCVYNNATSVLIEQNGSKCILNEDSSVSYMSTGNIDNLLHILLVATCAFIGFFGSIFSFIYYRDRFKDLNTHNWSLLNLCQRNAQRLDTAAACDKERLNDAYFVYSLQDDQFVSQILANVLERDIGYRLLLHYRDVHLHAFLSDAVFEAAETAKMLFIVLSKNFLYNEWSRMHYKSTLHELIVKRRTRLTFILYGDLPQRDIDADMRHYLRTSTCIEWDDKKFWSKLRSAMPTLRNKSSVAAAAAAAAATRPTLPNNCLGNNNRSAINIYATANTANTMRVTHADNLNNTHKRNANVECGFSTLNKHNMENAKQMQYATATAMRQRQSQLLAETAAAAHEYAAPAYLANTVAAVPTYDSVDYALDTATDEKSLTHKAGCSAEYTLNIFPHQQQQNLHCKHNNTTGSMQQCHCGIINDANNATATVANNDEQTIKRKTNNDVNNAAAAWNTQQISLINIAAYDQHNIKNKLKT